MATLRAWIVALLRRVLASLEPPAASGSVSADLIRDAVRVYVAEAETFAPGTSGEYKRHVVLAKLQKTFPAARTRDLAYAIEAVLQEAR